MSDYRYTECGLDNVFIKGVGPEIDADGDVIVSIPNILRLHELIALCLVTKNQGLTGKELRFLRTEMRLTQADLAALVKKDHQTIGRWERGETPIEPNAEYVIRTIAAERLKLDLKVSLEEIAARCVPAAEVEVIRIDGSNPSDYRPLAA